MAATAVHTSSDLHRHHHNQNSSYIHTPLTAACFIVLNRFIQLVQSVKNFLLYTTEVLLPNDNVLMSVGHLDHVLSNY